jgi:hypothetical protein
MHAGGFSKGDRIESEESIVRRRTRYTELRRIACSAKPSTRVFSDYIRLASFVSGYIRLSSGYRKHLLGVQETCCRVRVHCRKQL